MLPKCLSRSGGCLSRNLQLRSLTAEILVTSSPAGTCPDRANVEPAPLSQTFVSVEKPLSELVAADLKMGSYVAKNSSQRSHFERVVIGNRNVMAPALAGSQPQVAARLPCDFIPQAPQSFGKIRSRSISR